MSISALFASVFVTGSSSIIANAAILTTSKVVTEKKNFDSVAFVSNSSITVASLFRSGTYNFIIKWLELTFLFVQRIFCMCQCNDYYDFCDLFYFIERAYIYIHLCKIFSFVILRKMFNANKCLLENFQFLGMWPKITNIQWKFEWKTCLNSWGQCEWVVRVNDHVV